MEKARYDIKGQRQEEYLDLQNCVSQESTIGNKKE